MDNLSTRLQQMVQAIQNYKQDIAVVFGDEALAIFEMMQALAAEAKVAVDAKPPSNLFVLEVAGDWQGIYIDNALVWEYHAADQEALETHVPNWPKVRFIVDHNAIHGNRCPETYEPPTE